MLLVLWPIDLVKPFLLVNPSFWSKTETMISCPHMLWPNPATMVICSAALLALGLSRRLKEVLNIVRVVNVFLLEPQRDLPQL